MEEWLLKLKVVKQNYLFTLDTEKLDSLANVPNSGHKQSVLHRAHVQLVVDSREDA